MMTETGFPLRTTISGFANVAFICENITSPGTSCPNPIPMARDFHLRLQALRRLVLPPLVERELRAGARRPLFYWLRGLLALAAGFQGYELLDRFVMAPPPTLSMPWAAPSGTFITGATLLHQMSWLLFLATLLMGLVSADSINRERREGTLGLLLLTDLTPEEIVWGKKSARTSRR